ncbi:MAG: tetratricopeptide repeat protein [Verrucomicrobiota bacterium]
MDDNYVDGWRNLTQSILEGESFSGFERNCAFLNVGGARFATASHVAGIDFADDARALALSDWDGDGDIDVWSVNRTAPRIRFLKNNSDPDRSFLSLRLEGAQSNRDAIGARVEIEAMDEGKPKRWIRTLRAGEGFLSQSGKTLLFNLGSAEKADRLVIRWPSGQATELKDVSLGQRITLKEGESRLITLDPLPAVEFAKQPFEGNPMNESSEAQIRLTGQIPLPRLSWKTWEGGEKALRSEDKKPRLINLWASWCLPCHKELREFISHREEFDQLGLDVLALSVDGLGGNPGEPEKAQDYLRRWKFPYEQGVATPELLDALQLIQDELFDAKRSLPVPFSLLVDEDDSIAAIYRGAVSAERVLNDLGSLSLEGEALDDYALPFAGRWFARPSPASLFPVAWGLAESGDLQAGLSYVMTHRSELEPNDEFAKLLLLLANRLSSARENEIAISLYLETLKADPSLAEASYGLGLKLHEKGDLENARKSYLEAIKKDPELAKPYFMLALLLQQSGQEENASATAMALLQRAIKKDPQYVNAYRALAQLYRSIGRLEEAASLEEKADAIAR